MSSGKSLSAFDLFGDELVESPSNQSLCRKRKRNDALFEAIKIRMVMRIYGVSSEKARQIIAARVLNAQADD